MMSFREKKTLTGILSEEKGENEELRKLEMELRVGEGCSNFGYEMMYFNWFVFQFKVS